MTQNGHVVEKVGKDGGAFAGVFLYGQMGMERIIRSHAHTCYYTWHEHKLSCKKAVVFMITPLSDNNAIGILLPLCQVACVPLAH